MSRYSEYKVYVPDEFEEQFREFLSNLSEDTEFEWMGWCDE